MNVTIKTRTGEPKSIRATKVNDLFAVHRQVMPYGIADFWSVTHIPSGYSVATCATKRSGILVAKALTTIPVRWPDVREPNDPLLAPFTDEIKTAIYALRERNGLPV